MNKLLRSLLGKKHREKDTSILYPHELEMIGGKLICPDLIPYASTIISGGVGNDVEFELELIRRKDVRVIGIDPTTTAEKFIEKRRKEEHALDERYIFIKKALNSTNEPIKLFYGADDGMSSISAQHRDASAGNYFVCESITIEDLTKEYQNVSYLKIDVEGAEYGILQKLEKINVPQISIEFHHHCSTEYSIGQSIELIQKLEKMGYDAIDYGSYHGRGRDLPMYAAKWTDLNCELLFIKK